MAAVWRVFGFWIFVTCIGAVVAPAQIGMRPLVLPPAIIGEEYYVPIQGYGGGRCPLTDLRFNARALPPGFELTNNALQGTPTRIGSFPVAIAVQNDCTQEVKRYTLVVAAKPILTPTPEALEFRVKAGDAAPAAKNVVITADWSSLPYRVETEDVKWLHAVATAGITPPKGSALSGDPVHVVVDPSQLKPGTYHGSFKISASHSANQPVVPVTLIVEEK